MDKSPARAQIRPMSDPTEEALDQVEVRSYFVRERNALLTRAEFSPLYVDYYLHLAEHQIRPEPQADSLLKELLAAITLHAASRPWNETSAWTLHFEDPLLNLFASAASQPGRIVGQQFTENVKGTGKNLIYSDIVRGSDPVRRSVVDFEGVSPFRAAETLYAQSEQRPGRYFRHGVEDFVFVTAQPDCDLAWLEELDDEKIRIIDQTEVLSLLETRFYAWSCGCNQKRVFDMLASSARGDFDDLFAGEDSLRISCPRCGGRYVITREAMEAYNAESPQS